MIYLALFLVWLGVLLVAAGTLKLCERYIPLEGDSE